MMDAQVGLKTMALTLFLNLYFYFLPAAALCHDFSLVDSDSIKNSWIGLVNVSGECKTSRRFVDSSSVHPVHSDSPPT